MAKAKQAKRRAIVSRETLSPGRIAARYDAAQTTDDNRRHWVWADSLSANASNGIAVRRILRNRARYEVANNTYARGMTLTLANDTIGTGPRLYVRCPDSATRIRVHKVFSDWSKEIRLAEKLRTMRASKCIDGEAFMISATNPRLNHPVKLDFRLYEADQIGDPLFIPSIQQPVDGVQLDPFGNPIAYKVLKQHPGDINVTFSFVPEVISADRVIHYFRADRPGQYRGVPELTPALPLFAMLRDYTLATLDAAKAAAAFAGILYTDSAASEDDAPGVEAMDRIELARNALVSMPNTWKMAQVDAKHPNSTYEAFKHELINEVARCLNMPYNVAAGNSSAYNYASGRMDHQVYFKSIRVEQAYVDEHILDRILDVWIYEAVRIPGLLPDSMRGAMACWDHCWFWDGSEHVDPAKEASAQAQRLANNTTNLAIEYARQNRDWEAELNQRAKEIKLCLSLGVTPQTAPIIPGSQFSQPGAQPAANRNTQAPQDDPDDDTEEDDGQGE